jgi:homocysteine S-methyltransferase
VKNFLEDLKKRILVCDGAMGTMFYAQGIDPERGCEYLNIERPALVEDLHRRYIAAGADIIETNTFAANASQLEKLHCRIGVAVLNKAAVKIARKAAGSRVYVAGSVGPIGRLPPDLPPSDSHVYDIYKEQVLALATAGVDLFILETFSNVEHIKIALSVCKDLTRLPVVCQMVFLDGLRTSLGYSVRAAVEALEAGGADVIGVNCGNGPAAVAGAVEEIVRLTNKPVAAQPNAGYPQTVGGRCVYMSSPEYFAGYAGILAEAGASLVGGCCGTTPEHIRLIARDLRNRAPVRRQRLVSEKEAVFVRAPAFYEQRKGSKVQTIVELLPPKSADAEKLVDEAVLLKNSGADVFSCPENPLAQVRMSSIVAAGLVKKAVGLEAIFHYTCRDRNLIGLQSDLLGAYALGLRAVLVVTGDPVAAGVHPEASSVFDVDSVKLVKLIDTMKKTLSLDMRVGVAFNPNLQNMEGQLERLKRKIDAGAEFIMTQPMFDAGQVARVADALRPLGIPFYPGVLPLASKKNAEYLHNEVPGIRIPEDIRKRMDINEKQKAQQEGMAIALELMRATEKMVSGFYLISPLRKYEMTAAILKQLRS